MCVSVRSSTGSWGSLDALVEGGILTRDQALVGKDPDFGTDVCFCVSYPEAAFRAAGIPFFVDELGEIVLDG